MPRAAPLLLLFLLLFGACSHWLLDRDALGRAMVNDKRASALLGTDGEPKLSVKPGEKYFLEEGPPGDRQIHVYSKSLGVTTVIAAKPLHRDLTIQVIARYPGPPPGSTGE